MPLDAICLAAVREELSGRIEGMRIDKVQQPERDIIILALRGTGAPCRLLLSAGTGDARVHLTEHQFENPASPPMFCMLLRKHLVGARLVSVTQPPAERAIDLALSSPYELGDLPDKHLIVELIGRASNIILTGAMRPRDQGSGLREQEEVDMAAAQDHSSPLDPLSCDSREDGMIIDCLRRVGGGLDGKRAVLPGIPYRPPPVQEGKMNPLAVTADEWQQVFGRAPEKTADKWLQAAFSALSPLICRELPFRAYGQTDYPMSAVKDGGAALMREFFGLMDAANSGRSEPWSITDGNAAPKDFSYTRITQYESALEVSRVESFSALLDNHFTRSAMLERVRQRASAMTNTVKTARDRLVRKLAAQREELKKTGERDLLRQCGDIITTNFHAMEKGQSELVAQDYYSEGGGMRSIKLDPLKTPQQNAARYYKEYTKAKNAERFLVEQIELGEVELRYLESVLEEIGLAEGESDLAGIRAELAQTGYVRAQKQPNKKPAEPAPMRFVSSTGTRIFAGKNNIQNDRLTLKTASKSDVWLHVRKSHGSHVVIACNGGEPDEATLLEAASIAAHYSAARAGGKAAVDYTLVKNVKRQPGGRPGMVVYTDYKTIIAAPDEQLVNRLRKS